MGQLEDMLRQERERQAMLAAEGGAGTINMPGMPYGIAVGGRNGYMPGGPPGAPGVQGPGMPLDKAIAAGAPAPGTQGPPKMPRGMAPEPQEGGWETGVAKKDPAVANAQMQASAQDHERKMLAMRLAAEKEMNRYAHR